MPHREPVCGKKCRTWSRRHCMHGHCSCVKVSMLGYRKRHNIIVDLTMFMNHGRNNSNNNTIFVDRTVILDVLPDLENLDGEILLGNGKVRQTFRISTSSGQPVFILIVVYKYIFSGTRLLQVRLFTHVRSQHVQKDLQLGVSFLFQVEIIRQKNT